MTLTGEQKSWPACPGPPVQKPACLLEEHATLSACEEGAGGGGEEQHREGAFESNGTVMFEEGIRMGHLYDFGFEFVRNYVSSFWILWDEATSGADTNKNWRQAT